MKQHYLFRLTFDTPVHFGAAEQGGTLEKIRITAKSDTLLSAICTEAANIGGQEYIDRLIELIQQDKLSVSDLLPYYYDEKKKNIEYYLPKPILMPAPLAHKNETFRQAKQSSTERKKQKKMKYIRASEMKEYLAAIQTGRQYQATQRQFGAPYIVTRVNNREQQPLPYYVGAYRFAKQTGLYFILSLQEPSDIEWLCTIIDSLGYSGIGGKRTSGYGKFHLEEDHIELDEYGITEDDQTLWQMLSDTTSEQQMLISCLLPTQSDLNIVKQGTYQLIKRSGFYTDTADSIIKKRSSIYMIDSGSCLPSRISGTADILIDNDEHPIWRSGKGLYVGLPI